LTTNVTTTCYLIDSQNPTGYAKPIEQWVSTTSNRSTATLSMSYVIGDRVLAQVNGSGVVSYLLIDGQDNTRALTNSSGAVTATFNYSAFGDVLGATYTAANPPPTMYLFQQTMFDAPSGLNIFGDGVREVQPGEDSFIESDTSAYGNLSDPTTLNLRLLEGANPISGRDPSGHFDIFELGVVGTINAISFTVLTSPITTAVVQTVALLSLIEFAVDPDFRESVLAATGGDLTQLTEVFSGSVSYFAKKTVNLAEAAATAAFASKFAPTVTDGASAVVLDAAAMRTFFLARGLSQDSAAGYATSFANGSGVLREIKAGETFLRYSGPSQNAAGSFLTKGVYSTGSEAVQALDLAPKFGNDGSLVQSVTATQDTYVLEGGVANGAPGAYQAIAVDRNAFTYGPRVPTGTQP
jgi:hypothetical protein